MIFFLLQQLGVLADGLRSMMQGTNHTILRWYCMVTVPLQIQVSMSGLPIYSSAEASIFIWYYQDV